MRFFFSFLPKQLEFQQKTSIRVYYTKLHVLFSWRLNNMNISRNSYFSYPTMNCNHKCKVVDEKQKIISWEVEYVFFVKLHEISFMYLFEFQHSSIYYTWSYTKQVCLCKWNTVLYSNQVYELVLLQKQIQQSIRKSYAEDCYLHRYHVSINFVIAYNPLRPH